MERKKPMTFNVIGFFIGVGILVLVACDDLRLCYA
jgi:hypothetical protein